MSVRETLELDISDALASIEQVGDRLANVAQAFGEVLSESLEAALNGLPIITPEVDATPVSDEVEQALEQAAATPVEVAVDTDTISSDIDAAISEVDTTVEVTVEADTSQASQAVEQLGDALGGADGAADGASGSLTDAAVAASLLGKSVGDAPGVLGKVAGGLSAIGPAGVAAGTAFGVAATSVGFLYGAAFDAVAVTQAWENSLGPLGARIEDLDSGTTGLSGSLAQLAQDTGSSDEAVLIATQRYAEFQRAAGFSNDQIVENSQGIAVLAAQIRANNPNLGTMDEIINSLGRSLQRGGPRLQAYGISLNSADIEARALADSGKTVASELTNAEKSAAGLAIATEQLQPSAANLAGGLDNVAIKADRARQKFGDALETIGAPLVEPVTDALLELAEAFETLAGFVAEVSGAVGDKLTSAMEGFRKVADPLASAISSLTDDLSFFGSTAEDGAGGFDFLGGAVKGLARAAVNAVPGIGPLANVMADVNDALAGTTEEADATTEAIRNTGVAESEATRITNEFWRSVERTSNELANATAANSLFYASITTLAETAMSNIPQVTDAFRNLGTETNADKITGNLEAQIAATDTWTLNMTDLTKRGFDNITALMAELGPTQSAILLEQYRGREGELETHLEEMAAAQQRAAATINEIALRGYLTLNGITGAQANAIVLTLGAELQLGVPTQQRIDEVINAPATNELRVLAAYGKLGKGAAGAVETEMSPGKGTQIGNDFMAGLNLGTEQGGGPVLTRARKFATDLVAEINAKLGNSSPSKFMIESGKNLMAGLAIGVEEGVPGVAGAVDDLGRSVFGVNLAAGAPTIRDVTVQVPVTVSGGMTAEDGRAIGQAAGQAAAAEVARMMRLEARVA